MRSPRYGTFLAPVPGAMVLRITPAGRPVLMESEDTSSSCHYEGSIAASINFPYAVIVGSALEDLKDINGLGTYTSRGDILRSATVVYCLPATNPRLVREMSGKRPVQLDWSTLSLQAGAPLVSIALGTTDFELLGRLPLAEDLPRAVTMGDPNLPGWAKLPPTSALLREVDSGQVRLAHQADVAHPPASITKLLTIWLAREKMIADGTPYSEKITVSENAASVGSFWGIDAGSVISIRDLMRAAAIVSSNEAANALAEWHSGSQNKFLNELNKLGRRLGLRRSHFATPSGLGRTQTTTVHDAGLLAARFLRERDDVMPFFSEGSFSWGAKTKKATNRLVEVIPGASGLKTGTLKPYGFNLLFTAHVRGKDFVAVVLGAGSRASRDRIIRVLLGAI